MPIIAKIFWVIAIGVTCLNAYVLRSRARKEIAQNPELADGYRQLITGYLILCNLPWLVMGLGMLVGHTPDVFDYLNPRSGNPYVVGFHVTGIFESALISYWIYLAGGAEILVTHPGVMNYDIKSPLVVKLLFGLMLLGGMAAEIALWSGRFPVRSAG
jgi:hypothetical protein